MTADRRDYLRFADQRFQQSCKPNSVCVPFETERIICLSDHYPKRVPPKWNRSGPLHRFLFGLAPDGVFRAPAITLGAVGFYPTFSPLPGPQRVRRFKFLWHYLSAASRLHLPRVLEPM